MNRKYFTYKGLKCLTVMNDMNILCGYVYIPLNSTFYKEYKKQGRLDNLLGFCVPEITYSRVEKYIEYTDEGFYEGDKMFKIGFHLGEQRYHVDLDYNKPLAVNFSDAVEFTERLAAKVNLRTREIKNE